MKLCVKCKKPIAQGRLDFFRQDGVEIHTCTDCSSTEKYFAVQVYDHKTAGYSVILPQKKGKTDPESKRQALRAYFRSR